MRKRQPNQQPFKRGYWVIPGKLLVGGHPSHSDPGQSEELLDGLIEAGINVFLDLTEKDERDESGNPLPDYEAQARWLGNRRGVGVRVKRAPVPAGQAPSLERMQRILTFIDECLDAKEGVFVHSRLGRGRAGTVVACYLLHQGAATQDTVADTVMRLSRDIRQGQPSPETPEQQAFVREFPSE